MDPVHKRQFNEHHFTICAPRYDVVTRLLSFGRDRSWKSHLIDELPPLSRPKILYLACGTGDITFLLHEKYPDGQIEGLDVTHAMLNIAAKRNRFAQVSFVKKEMCPLEYPDGSFDIVTGGYALRNAPVLTDALKEIQRALKPGGIGAFLDFSKPKNKILQWIQYWVLKFWGSGWGLILHGNPQIHGYIAASLRTYPDRSDLDSILTSMGFLILKKKRFFLGMTEITIFQKT